MTFCNRCPAADPNITLNRLLFPFFSCRLTLTHSLTLERTLLLSQDADDDEDEEDEEEDDEEDEDDDEEQDESDLRLEKLVL